MTRTEWAPHLQHHRAVESAALVRSLDAPQVEIGPVDEVPILGQTEGLGEFIHHDLPLKTCRRTRAIRD